MAPPNARRNTAIAASVCYFITIPFLILVLLGNTHINTVLSDIYFFRLNVANIIPISVQNARLLNSVARSLGLSDFYQVGVWNFCSGYFDEGVKRCSSPEQFYWFNPVEILVNDLIAGAQIALPSQVVTILDVLQILSNVMYVCFIAGIVINFILFLASPLVIITRWWTLALALLGLLAALCTTIAAAIATAFTVVARIALTAQDQLNIKVEIGVKMFCFMWIAAFFTILAWLLHAALGCCCRPQPRNKGSTNGPSKLEEKKDSTGTKLPSFVRRRRGAPSHETTNGS